MTTEKRKIAIVVATAVALILVLVLIAAVIGKDDDSRGDLSGDITYSSEESKVSGESDVLIEDGPEQETDDSQSSDNDADAETSKSSIEDSETKQNANSSQVSRIEAEESSFGSSATQTHFASTDSDDSSSSEPEESEASSSEDKESGSSGSDIPVQEPEEQYAQIAGGKITCDSFGRFSGQYVEDGRDELVESVAAILVTNRSNEYLEYATLTFDIDGEGANFIVTGLPAGASAWVLEAGKLAIVSGADFTYQDCVSSFREDIVVSSDKIALKADGNMLTATNTSSETLKNVVVYYRVLHTDGNYLGGITYTANFDTLEPGASTEVLAGHYSADDCEVVRVSWGN